MWLPIEFIINKDSKIINFVYSVDVVAINVNQDWFDLIIDLNHD